MAHWLFTARDPPARRGDAGNTIESLLSASPIDRWAPMADRSGWTGRRVALGEQGLK
jgi:hypothetical protein